MATSSERGFITESSSRSFADELRHRQCLKTHGECRKPKGRFTIAKVPRPESERLIRRGIDARVLLDDLCAHIGVDTVLGLSAGPNSGVSAMIPETSKEDRQC